MKTQIGQKDIRWKNTYHTKTTDQKKKKKEVHCTFFSLYTSKLKEVPSCHLNEKKDAMPWHGIWQSKGET